MVYDASKECPNCYQPISRLGEHVMRERSREAPAQYSCRTRPLEVKQPDVVAEHFARKTMLPLSQHVETPRVSSEAQRFVNAVSESKPAVDELPCPLCHELMTWTGTKKPRSFDWCDGCRDRARQLLSGDNREAELFRSKIVVGNAATLFELRRLIIYPGMYARRKEPER